MTGNLTEELWNPPSLASLLLTDGIGLLSGSPRAVLSHGPGLSLQVDGSITAVIMLERCAFSLSEMRHSSTSHFLSWFATAVGQGCHQCCPQAAGGVDQALA